MKRATWKVTMEETQNNPLEDLVQHALDQDFNKANKVFGDLMGTKINDLLDQEKIKIAGQIYNDEEPEEEEDFDAETEDDADEVGDDDLDGAEVDDDEDLDTDEEAVDDDEDDDDEDQE